MLKEQVAVVTGAANGIGRETAMILAENGAKLVIADIDFKKASSVAADISEKTGTTAFAVNADVSNEESVVELFEKAYNSFGKIDILVNNAGIQKLNEVVSFPLSEWEQVFDVIMKGTFLCSREALKYMIKQKSGSIIQISSCSARKADLKHSAYAAAKAAVIAFNRVMADEVGKYGIRCNCILPGATKTDMLLNAFEKVPGLEKSIVERTSLGRLAIPRDQANAALFFASELASHITGENLIVSGGEYYDS